MSCGVSRRHGSDPALLWLWYRPAAVALTGPLAWESPYAVGAALKSKRKKKISDCYSLKALKKELTLEKAQVLLISNIKENFMSDQAVAKEILVHLTVIIQQLRELDGLGVWA